MQPAPAGTSPGLPLAVLLVLATLACGREPSIPLPTPPGARVVVLVVDGLRPDAITTAHAPTLKRLIGEGAASAVGQTVLPSFTLPAHTSLVTGLPPSRHGITWNDDVSPQTRPLEVVTIFELLKERGYTSALFAGKPKLRQIVRTALARQSLPAGDQIWLAERVVSHVAQYLGEAGEKATFLLVHLPDVDLAGHEFGWMGTEYLAAVRRTDAAVARLVELLRLAFGENLTLMVTADHGGAGRGHGDSSIATTRIPWIAWGHRVQPQTVSTAVRLTDVGATVLWLLDVPVPAGWEGAPLRAPFTPSAASAQLTAAPR